MEVAQQERMQPVSPRPRKKARRRTKGGGIGVADDALLNALILGAVEGFGAALAECA